MFAETLKLGRAATPEEQAACVDFIFEESQRLGRLAERTLDWARLEAGRRAYDRRPHPPEPLARAVVERFLSRGQVAREAVAFACEGPLPEIDVDAAAFEQVALNLLENAAKYTPAQKRIEVRLEARGRRVLLHVKDNGIGVSKRDQRRIFDRFYRADDLLARRTEGTGLGLSIARRIVEAHGGRIRVESRPGAGACFTVEWPAAPPRQEPS